MDIRRALPSFLLPLILPVCAEESEYVGNMHALWCSHLDSGSHSLRSVMGIRRPLPSFFSPSLVPSLPVCVEESEYMESHACTVVPTLGFRISLTSFTHGHPSTTAVLLLTIFDHLFDCVCGRE